MWSWGGIGIHDLLSVIECYKKKCVCFCISVWVFTAIINTPTFCFWYCDIITDLDPPSLPHSLIFWKADGFKDFEYKQQDYTVEDSGPFL